MLLAVYPPAHAKHLPLDPLRLRVLPIAEAAVREIERRAKPLSALLRLVAHPRPPRLPKPVRIAPVNACSHVWHSHHTVSPRCACCDTAFSIRQPMCARPLPDRHAQPDWIGGGSESRQMMQHSDSADEEM